MQISLKLKEIAALNGYNVVLTRKDDNAIYDLDKTNSLRAKKVSDMYNRLKIMKDNPNSVFISIHLNKFSSGKVNGAQVFYAKNIEESKRLAECIQTSIEEFIQSNNKKSVKENTDKIFLLKNAVVPSVIVECGFLSNENDLKNLKNNEFQYKIAMCIFLGILENSNME